MARKTLTELQKQIAALQRQADALKKKEAKGVIARIKTAIAHYGLSAADLGLGGSRGTAKAAGTRRRKTRRSIGKIKFRDGAGNAWTGHGRRPKWFVDALAAGKTREDLAV